ncbi:B3 domain-containing protein Os12g0592300 isoform X1 [Physcomitrium patens]|uniref:TF-B3 domain-containing protein n=1 Tax=Physcomitrium patens TaxID=3218 RepID=A0A2K1IZ07_PHYPA|nr:B3 domain-containing protein Os12g0591400-like isoform X1 [Physcomitrium patens]XP_024356630.1 B3 domain-containing protein Os12g0591400-like isoform X1 [Physcomitrium patens]PNR34505.1 hypothetical protein PHYPA_024322 [Physcomitrium patens]|eukprot:XP_024356629.1 B3 domain-containing protein Os12g0591400-like isoform X1 [Physcomitrella patens]
MERACELCLKNCLRLHGAEESEAAKSCLICVLWRSEGVKSDQTDRHPSFLKKITESTMSTLELPTSFVRDYIGSLHESVILEGPSSKQWRVELHGYGEGFNISFGQGWNNFAVDHGLQIGDQLSFSLSKKSYFQVEVYDGFGVLKRRAPDVINTPMEVSTKNVERKNQQNLDTSPCVGRTEPNNLKNATQPAGHLLTNLAKLTRSECRIISSPNIDAEIAKASKSEDSRHSIMQFARVDKGELLPPHKFVNGTVMSKRRPITELEKVVALKAARALNLVKPNTLVVMSKGHVYKGFLLGIPKQFSKDWLPSESKEITLANKSGHRWTVKWLPSHGGLSAGWRRFSLDHRLEEYDVCVFELVDKAHFVLLVHIFRVLGSPQEDEGLYTPTSPLAKSSEGKRNNRKPFQVSQDIKVDSTPRKASGHVTKRSQHSSPGPDSQNGKSTSEPAVEVISLKRKICVLALPALSAKKGLGNQNHQPSDTVRAGPNIEAAVDSALSAYTDFGGKVRVAPRAPCDVERTPTTARQDSEAFRSELMKLTKDLLIRNGVGRADPTKHVLPDGHALSADDMHKHLAKFVDTPPSVSRKGKGEWRGREYKVVRICRGRNVGNDTEFLAELEGYSENNDTKLARDDVTGYWWIPSDHFSWDMLTCYFE